MRHYLYLLFLIITLQAAKSEPIVSTNIQYYEVRGKTENEIRKNINLNPQRKFGYDARVDWNIKWNYRWYEEHGDCKFTSITVYLKVDYLMPKLADSEIPEPLVKLKWDAYYTALKEHEDGHAQHGNLAAREIESALHSIGSKKGCKNLEQAAQGIAEQIIQKYVKLEKDYDIATNHGALTGAKFP